MAITNYEQLRRAIIDWSHREDDVLLRVDDFIRLTEDKIGNGLKLRSLEARSQATLPEGERFLALPNQFIQMRDMRILDNNLTIELFPSPITNLYVKPFTGRPVYFSVTSELVFDILADRDYTLEMDYFVDMTPLSSAQPTNHVLANYPGLYLYGALAEVFSWAQDDQQAVKYTQLFDDIMIKANRKENRGRYGPAPVRVSTRATP